MEVVDVEVEDAFLPAPSVEAPPIGREVDETAGDATEMEALPAAGEL